MVLNLRTPSLLLKWKTFPCVSGERLDNPSWPITSLKSFIKPCLSFFSILNKTIISSLFFWSLSKKQCLMSVYYERDSVSLFLTSSCNESFLKAVSLVPFITFSLDTIVGPPFHSHGFNNQAYSADVCIFFFLNLYVCIATYLFGCFTDTLKPTFPKLSILLSFYFVLALLQCSLS